MTEDRRGDRSHGPAPATDDRIAGHETSDVSIGPIVKFGIGLAAATILIQVAVWGYFRLLQARERREDQPVSRMVAASLRRTPPEPRLEPDPLALRHRVRASEDAVLTTYGWVDRSAGVARIPITRAMEILVERGLPVTKPLMPAPTPGAGHGTQDTGREKNP
ncbi:MAG TPA: hypothetical protein VGK86_04735 [Thermoanaerobaculia bacterium]